ncbi:hypothetical protein MRX96_026901 [Rhipicephalus microplus]
MASQAPIGRGGPSSLLVGCAGRRRRGNDEDVVPRPPLVAAASHRHPYIRARIGAPRIGITLRGARGSSIHPALFRWGEGGWLDFPPPSSQRAHGPEYKTRGLGAPEPGGP